MKNKCYAKFGRGQGVCLFVCFYGPSVEVNKLVFEGQLQQIPNRGDHVGNQSENNNIYFRLPTCEWSNPPFFFCSSLDNAESKFADSSGSQLLIQ